MRMNARSSATSNTDNGLLSTPYLPPREMMKKKTGHIRASNAPQLDLKATLVLPDRDLAAKTLLDSGCTSSSIHDGFVRKHKIPTQESTRAIPVYNADGTLNGHVKHYVELPMKVTDDEGTTHEETIRLQVVNLGGSHSIFLGHDWLTKHNPLIDWRNNELTFARCPPTCGTSQHSRRAASRTTYIRRLETYEDEGYARAVYQTKSTQLAATAHAISGKDKKTSIPAQYSEYKDVFEKKEFDKLPERKPWDHAINLLPGRDDGKAMKGRVYSKTKQELEELNKFIDENLATGRIRESQSRFAAPFFFIKKKDGSLRPVQDYRRLNEITVKDSWPLPVISDIMHKIKDAKIFSKMDVRWGFNNVRIKEGDEWKAAFICERGLLEPTVMFFGMCNSPATFQHMMDNIFSDLIRSNKVIVYLDDILVFTETLEEHRKIMHEVLKRLRQNKLYLKPEKCEFEQSKLGFLGVIVGGGEIAMDPVKTEAIRNWPTPRNLKDVRSFVQFGNFYRTFIPNFADITAPLNELMKKNVKFEWGPRQEQAFNKIKHVIAEDVTLLLPVPNARFRLETDASDYAVGAVLHQIIDGKARPIGHFSKTMDEAQRNYQIFEKEALAVQLALAFWRHLLMDGPEFDIWTDHKNIEYFREPQKLNRRQARWQAELQNYNCKIHYRPGRLNVVADALSRKDEPRGGVEDNTNQILYPPRMFDYETTTVVNRLSFRDEEEILEEVRRRRQQLDDQIQAAVKTKNRQYKETNGIVEYNGLVCVPRNRTLRESILYAHHDTPVAGHPGRHKTLELIQRNWFWPNMRKDVNKYVAACETCQRTKPRTGPLSGPLHPHDPPSEPWEVISVDLIGPLATANGFDAIMTVVDKLTKMVIAIPTTTTQTAEQTAQLFLDRVFSRFGLPKKIISDRGPQFVANFTTELYKMLGITGNPSTAYRPQTDGQSEAANKELEKILRALASQKQETWPSWLPCAEFAINNRASRVTGASPFQLNYGRNPNFGVNPRRSSTNESAFEFATRMKQVAEETEAAITLANAEMKRHEDQHRRQSPDFQIGQEVWLDSKNLKLPNNEEDRKKLADKRVGPFKILKKIGPSAYELDIPPGWGRTHPVFNEELLTSYIPPVAKHQEKPPPPPPETIDDEEYFEVEAILNSRKMGRGIQYLVKFTGYSPEHNQWLPAKNFDDFEDKKMISEFHRNHPDKPKPGTPAPKKKTTRKRKAKTRVIRPEEKQTYPRSLFPPDLFQGKEPLTSGIDSTMPGELELARAVRHMAKEKYKKRPEEVAIPSETTSLSSSDTTTNTTTTPTCLSTQPLTPSKSAVPSAPSAAPAARSPEPNDRPTRRAQSSTGDNPTCLSRKTTPASTSSPWVYLATKSKSETGRPTASTAATTAAAWRRPWDDASLRHAAQLRHASATLEAFGFASKTP